MAKMKYPFLIDDKNRFLQSVFPFRVGGVIGAVKVFVIKIVKTEVEGSLDKVFKYLAAFTPDF